MPIREDEEQHVLSGDGSAVGCRSVPKPSAVQQPCSPHLRFDELSRTSRGVVQWVASKHASGPLVASALSKVLALSRLVSAEEARASVHAAISLSYGRCKLKLVGGALGRTSPASGQFLLSICGGDVECIYLATPPPTPQGEDAAVPAVLQSQVSCLPCGTHPGLKDI